MEPTFHVEFVGGPVSWPPGMARRILDGELVVAVASFESPDAADAAARRRKRKQRAAATTQLRKGESVPLGLRFAVADAQGVRPRMEDRFCASLSCSQRHKDVALMAIFDGHGGVEAATVAAELMVEEFSRALDELEQLDVARALQTAFRRVESEVMAVLTDSQSKAGTTALVTVVTPTQLTVANLGDSRAVLSRRNFEILPLSTDHKGLATDERERIAREGGRVDPDGYVGGLVQVSRAFGDIDPKTGDKIQGLSSTPDIVTRALEPHADEFLLLACDGLWDFISADGAVSFVTKRMGATKGDVRQTAEDLVQHALDRKSNDNVTVLLVSFHDRAVGEFWKDPAPAASEARPPSLRQRMMAMRAAAALSSSSSPSSNVGAAAAAGGTTATTPTPTPTPSSSGASISTTKPATDSVEALEEEMDRQRPRLAKETLTKLKEMLSSSSTAGGEFVGGGGGAAAPLTTETASASESGSVPGSADATVTTTTTLTGADAPRSNPPSRVGSFVFDSSS